ncbi:thioredoxin domain-containing protein [candidate division KSB1 bacterium]
MEIKENGVSHTLRQGQPLKNRLGGSSSSYLLSAAEQPVCWQEWSNDIFDMARELDRPILLDIGAVWCHWCHVMDRESYENEEIAQILNEKFIPVKVDRDERPDVDRRYQAFVQALGGGGGWPLTCFLTPEGKIFYGGTYFPPEEGMGKPSFRNVLEKVNSAYHEDREKILQGAEDIFRRISAIESEKNRPGDLGPSLVNTLLGDISASFDPVHGGFGDGTKFPNCSAIYLVLTLYHDLKEERLFQIAETSLTKMAEGGMHDHIGGGFHRYSVDPYWHVPHFEKMTSDNAELLQNYLLIFRMTGDSKYLRAIEGILSWYEREMTDRENGGFYAHQDADISLEDDGDYFTWTKKEIEDALPPDQARLITLYFGISDLPQDLHGTPERNVLYTVRQLSDIARELGLSVEHADELYLAARARLLELRSARKAPFIDTIKYANYNGMMISAYAAAFKVLQREELKTFTVKSLDFILEKMFDSTHGFAHVYSNGEAGVSGLLSDQIWMAQALLDGFEISGDIRYLEYSIITVDLVLENFFDSNAGGFFDRVHDEGRSDVLNIRHKPVEDVPVASANAVAIRVLDRLFALTEDAKYVDAAEKTLRVFAGSVAGKGPFMSAYGLSAYYHMTSPPQIIIIGNKEDKRLKELLKTAHTVFRPGKSVYVFDAESPAEKSLPAAVRDKCTQAGLSSGPTAFVCAGQACAPPTGDAQELEQLILSFGKQ